MEIGKNVDRLEIGKINTTKTWLKKQKDVFHCYSLSITTGVEIWDRSTSTLALVYYIFVHELLVLLIQ